MVRLFEMVLLAGQEICRTLNLAVAENEPEPRCGRMCPLDLGLQACLPGPDEMSKWKEFYHE